MMTINSIAALISSGFTSGYAPKAPGTVGSFAAVIVWCGVSWFGALSSLEAQILAALFVSVLGLWATGISLDVEGGEDPQWIVVDEWAGQFIALVGISYNNLWHVLLAFALFRLFDIVKPWPIRRVEELPGGFGVMCDDILAGIAALIVLSLLRLWI